MLPSSTGSKILAIDDNTLARTGTGTSDSVSMDSTRAEREISLELGEISWDFDGA